MYATEVGLRRVIRNPMIERDKEVIDVEDIKRRALSGEKPYDYFGVSLGTNPSVGEINSFVYTYCFRRGMYDQKKIESYIAYISTVVAIKVSRDLKQHEYYLDLVDI
tara:strand:+ start:455 stop:775 length:321 start_codon:yes stop_codon:yes gene_type:complete